MLKSHLTQIRGKKPSHQSRCSHRGREYSGSVKRDFKNNRIKKFAAEIAGARRFEIVSNSVFLIFSPVAEFILKGKIMKNAAFLFLLFFLALVVPAQKKKVETVKLTGQIVCSACWDEADRTTTAYGTAADFECAEECAEKGILQALAVKNFDGKFVLYLLEKGKFDNKAKNWMPYIAKQVEIEGAAREEKGKLYLRVDDLKIITPKKKE